MGITKTTVPIEISNDAQTLICAKGVGDAVNAALNLLPEFFAGTMEVDVDSYSEPEEHAEPHLSFEVAGPLDRAAFRNAVADFFAQLRRERNPIHLYLAVVKR